MITDEIKNNIRSLSDSDLINLIANGKDYRKDALLFAQEEVKNRCINKELYSGKLSRLSKKRELENRTTVEDLTVGEKIKKNYISTLSLSIGILAAFVLYNNSVIEGFEVFSFEDKRVVNYERHYFNFMLFILNVFTAIGGIVYGLAGLVNFKKNNKKNYKNR